ncbi:hypothetical protein [Staphylococcus phage PT1-4]
MDKPICQECGGQAKKIDEEKYECIYCGNLLDEYGDVVYEI